MALTQIDQQTFNTVVGQHQQVQDYIKNQQSTLREEITNLQSTNSGNLISSLVTVHQNWDDSMTDIVNQLGNMIEAMQSTASGLQNQDAQNHA